MIVSTLIATLSVLASVHATSSITLQPGTVSGAQCTSNTKAVSFLGLPFAKPPTGDLRFASPVALDASFKYEGGNLNATKQAPICPQFAASLDPPATEAEDCLYLNVFVPANATSDSVMPVKVFIYGGSFDSGGTADPLYNGCNLATDAVVVTLAYRVGALGFLGLESAGIPGNMGLQDLKLGIQWVQDNIAAFGGDPKKVLVFGESAGAGLTWALATMSDAPSYMKAAISESGAGTVLPTNEQYQNFSLSYANNLGCDAQEIACFRSKSIADLVKATPANVGLSLQTTGRWTLFVDGNIIPKQPATLPATVPFLAGTNSMEGTLFVATLYNTPSNLSSSEYTTELQDNFGNYANQVSQLYPLEQYNATGFAPFYALSQIVTDAGFKCSSRRALNLTNAANVPAYTYFNSHVPTCSWEQNIAAQELQVLGATHSSELPLVFSQTSSLPPTNGTCSLNEQEVAISNTLTTGWTSMAETGNPGASWPKFNVSTGLGLLIVNETAFGPINYTICDIWDKVAAMQLANATMTQPAPANVSGVTGTSASASPSASSFSISSGSVSSPLYLYISVFAVFMAAAFTCGMI